MGTMMLKAQEMVRDFPDFVRNDIESGKFSKALRKYEKNWRKNLLRVNDHRRPFNDYGQITQNSGF